MSGTYAGSWIEDEANNFNADVSVTFSCPGIAITANDIDVTTFDQVAFNEACWQVVAVTKGWTKKDEAK